MLIYFVICKSNTIYIHIHKLYWLHPHILFGYISYIPFVLVSCLFELLSDAFRVPFRPFLC